MSNLKLIIKADTNDADYITQESDLCDSLENGITLELVKKVVGVINKVTKEKKKAFKGNAFHFTFHNWPTSEYRSSSPQELYKDYLTEEEIEYFSDRCPYGEYGIHTITSVRIVEIVSDLELVERV